MRKEGRGKGGEEEEGRRGKGGRRGGGDGEEGDAVSICSTSWCKTTLTNADSRGRWKDP